VIHSVILKPPKIKLLKHPGSYTRDRIPGADQSNTPGLYKVLSVLDVRSFVFQAWELRFYALFHGHTLAFIPIPTALYLFVGIEKAGNGIIRKRLMWLIDPFIDKHCSKYLVMYPYRDTGAGTLRV